MNTRSDQAFELWISQFPETYHPLDVNRFYSLVKAVCESGEYKNASWLEQKIRGANNKRMTDELIENYCDKFTELQDFYKVIKGEQS